MRYSNILVCLVIFSCVSRIDQSDYQDAISNFPDSLVSHFPEELITKYGLTHTYESKYSPSGLYLSIPFSSIADSINSIINKENIIDYGCDDPCLFVVNRYYRFDKYGVKNDYNSKLALPEKCPIEYLPIPNFRVIGRFRNNGYFGLPTGYLIYVLDAKSLDSTETTKSNWRRWMPKNWAHGFSKGFAINREEKDIIFWAINW